GIRDFHVTGVQTCALPIYHSASGHSVMAVLYFSRVLRRSTGTGSGAGSSRSATGDLEQLPNSSSRMYKPYLFLVYFTNLYFNPCLFDGHLLSYDGLVTGR